MIVTAETKATAQGVLDYLIANPEKHNQSNWVANASGYIYHESTVTEDNICDTTMCIAGTAVYLTGGIDLLNEIGQQADAFDSAGDWWVKNAGPLLGLNEVESNQLFYEMDEAHALDMVNAIANGDEEKFKHLASLEFIPLDEDY